eukprot:TRINITY_DN1798_c3_g1_i1.p1 TRINITY_DN1798_c3_g1~~TRINITY_DN1798_c3_g1_i1.p1  ORF type:complete len:389 (-),score=127.13 TRINITY_DN1798_c3_g1_i1:106-1272(-)
MWGKIKKGATDAKQTAMRAIGKGATTVDAAFDEEEKRFSERYKLFEKLQKFGKSYEHTLAQLTKGQAEAAAQINSLYEQCGTQSHTAQVNQKVAGDIESMHTHMMVQMEDRFNKPLGGYFEQYKAIKQRNGERKKRLIDMDQAAADLQSKQAKPEKNDPMKIQAAQEKASQTRKHYEVLNTELLGDMPKLLQDTPQFFDCVFANFVDFQVAYFKEVSRILIELEAPMAGVDRNAYLTPIWVVTEAAYTTSGKTLPPGGGGAYGGPPPTQGEYGGPPPQEGGYGGPPPHDQQQGGGYPGSAPQQQQYGGPPPDQQQPGGYPAPVPAAAPPAAGGKRGKALYTFAAEDDSELPFSAGDVITITRQDDPGWWIGEYNGKTGMFPSNYVQIL